MTDPHAETHEPPLDVPSSVAEETSCPFCCSGVPAHATKCASCGSNIGNIKICPSCVEPVRLEATVCPHCRTELGPQATIEELEYLAEPWVLVASPYGAFTADKSVTALFMPPELIITATEIHIRRRMFLGLRTVDSKIQVSRVASVRTTRGPIWTTLIIETYGGAAAVLSIGGLDRDDAANAAMLIERLARLDSKVQPSR